MLQSLHVKNFALMEELEVAFDSGLNILTGETGAGKSLLLGSVNLALGAKADTSLIRKGAEFALVELTFHTTDQEVQKKLQEMDIERNEDDTVLISRKISAGTNTCKINGEKVTVKQLKELATFLLDIHGQHEHQSLLNKSSHLHILDQYCAGHLDQWIQEYRDCYSIWKEKKAILETERNQSPGLEKDLALATFELQEIQKAELKIGEDEELESSYRKMVNYRKIMEGLGECYQTTAGDAGSASDLISAGLRALSQVASFDEQLEGFENELSEIDSLLSDFNRELSSYLSSAEFDEALFQELEYRINEINRLKDKYGRTIEDILAYGDQLQLQIEKFNNYDLYMEKLEQEVEESYEKTLHLGQKLREIRQKSAKELEKLLSINLLELNFLAADFEISFSELELPNPNGLDDVEFMISTNPGESRRPLREVASGGELSRIMLAIRTIMAGIDNIGSLIFDEIDTGISGKTAWKVSGQMLKVSKEYQVLCITHLPQIAAMADAHFVIDKGVTESGVVTSVTRVDGEDSLKELARLLGSDELTESALENARQMRMQALEVKRG